MILEILRWICRIALGVSGLYGMYFTITSLLMFGRYRQPEAKDQPIHRMAILVFAKNEEQVIGNLIQSLKQQDYPRDAFSIFVTADNCTDRTAAVAREAGAVVYERSDPKYRSKGYAMNWFFPRFLREYKDRFDACVVFDADNVVDRNYLAAMNRQLNAGHPIAIGYRQGKNPSSTWISGCSSLFWLMQTRCFHYPRARMNLPCCSVGGTGFMFDLAVLGKKGWYTRSVCEDIEFTLQSIADGFFIAYAPDAIFYDEQPLTMVQSLKQRYRWSLGSVQILSLSWISLFRAWISGKKKVFDAMLYSLGVIITGVSGLFWVLLIVLDTAFSGNWSGLLRMLAISIASGYVTVAAVAGLVLILEHKKWPGYWKAILTFPVYLVPWSVINVVVLFYRNTVWHDIPHQENFSLEDINSSYRG